MRTGRKSYSVQQTARVLGVSYRSVLRYLAMKNEGLKGVKVGVSPRRMEWRITHTAIKDFLKYG
jgi:molybdenum-dependent DNA-binding transcriptional regulator ModE